MADRRHLVLVRQTAQGIVARLVLQATQRDERQAG